jgi:nucleotide-binding universal stress UspA family protein
MIVLCYDGSSGARAAVDLAAGAMPGAETTVLTIWESFLDVMVRSGAIADDWGASAGAEDYAQLDQASEQAAREIAAEGVQRARDAGLRAEPRVVSRHRGIGESILTQAADVRAELIFVGTRGRGDVRSFLLGSVSHYLVQHADRPVSVVPSPALVERRRHVHPAMLTRNGSAPARASVR